MNELLSELSLISFVKISNTFTLWWPTPETRKWTLEAEHCTHRGVIVKLEGYDLDELLREAIDTLEEYHQAQGILIAFRQRTMDHKRKISETLKSQRRKESD